MKKPIAPSIIELAIGDTQVRITPDKRVSLFDVLKIAVGKQNPRQAWANLQREHPEVVQFTDNYRFPGSGQRPTPTVDKHGFTEIMMLLPGAKAAEFRRRSADIIVRYLDADPTLTADLIERTEDPVDLERLGERLKSKASVLALQSEAKDRGMVRRFDYAKMNDENNVFITGNTASEIKSLRETEITRDSFSTGELALLNLTQHAQVQLLRDRDVRGAGAILGSNQEVRDDLRPFRDKYFGEKRRPADKNGQAPAITVPV